MLKDYIPNFKGMPFWEVWKRRFLEKSYMNTSLKAVVRDKNFYSTGLATYSGRDKVTYYYTIDGFPNKLPLSWHEEFRDVLEVGVKVKFIEHLEPTKIEWNSAAMKSRLNIWQQIENDNEEVNEYNLQENIVSLNSTSQRKESLVYLANATQVRGRQVFITRTLMILSGKRGKAFDTSVENVEEVAKDLGISMNRVTSGLKDIISAFSPASAKMDTSIKKEIGNTTLPDEIVARFSNFDQGKVGTRGIYWGTDIYSGFPVLKLVKRTADSPENWLIVAPTGWGKSFKVKNLLNQLNADPRFKGTIMDIEGFEYKPMGGFMARSDKVVILNMSEGSGSYYDPVEINLTGKPELDEDMLSTATSFTKSILNVLLTAEEDEKISTSWVSNIISDIVSTTYTKAGVLEDDMSTWENSKGLTLKDCYKTFKSMYYESVKATKEDESSISYTENYKLNEDYLKAMDFIASRLRTFFESFEDGGFSSSIFKRRVSLKDIADAKLLICSFGLAGKSEDSIDPVRLALSQTYAAIISQVRSTFIKAEGLYNYKLWEELQRWGRIPGSESALNVALTGGRKNGDVNIVVTNKISEMLNEDKFGVFQNTQSFAIGGIDDARIRKDLCEALSIPHLQFELAKIATSVSRKIEGVTTIGSIYDYSFLVKLDKADIAIVKVELPDEFLDSDSPEGAIFRTGVKGQKGDLR